MCTETICKILLYVINIAFFLAGGAILAVGIVALVNEDLLYSLVDFLTGTLANVFEQLKVLTSVDLGELIVTNAIILTVVGAVLFGLGFFGCCGACKKNVCMLTIYSVIVLLIAGLQIGIAVYAYAASDKVEAQIKGGLIIALDKSYSYGYRFDSSGNLEEPTRAEDIAWDYLQVELGCCGVNNDTDYLTSAFLWNRTYSDVPGGDVTAMVPPSCCQVNSKGGFPANRTALDFKDLRGCMTMATATSTYQTGCYDSVKQIFLDNQVLIIAIFCIIVVIEILAVAAACILKSKAEK